MEDFENIPRIVEEACANSELARHRFELLRHSANEALRVGRILRIKGAILGPDRVSGHSPYGNGSDETAAISILLCILHELADAAADLFEKGLVYAAAALLRQLVEVEYLAWAVESRDKDAERWLRCDKSAREQIFRPASLRRAAGSDRFRSVDYSFHCDHGGHPTPMAQYLLEPSSTTTQILLVDALGHSGRVWDHLARWARETGEGPWLAHAYPALVEKFVAWKNVDPLAHLPAPNLGK